MAIAFEQVDFSYSSGQKVLDGFSLTLPEAGVLCLSGPSGCGKTTLLKLLAGLETPQDGCITGLDGLRTAVVFQEDRLLPWKTAAGNVALASPGKVSAQAREHAVQWLERMGLADVQDRYPDELSGGMKRRVAIARALSVPADLLILDEPFVGLEAKLWTRIAAEIHTAYAEKPVVLVTHIAEQAAIMKAKVVRLGGPPLTILLDGAK